MQPVVLLGRDVVRSLVLHLRQRALVALAQIAIRLELSLGARDLALLGAKVDGLGPGNGAGLAASFDPLSLLGVASVDRVCHGGDGSKRKKSGGEGGDLDGHGSLLLCDPEFVSCARCRAPMT